MSDPYIFVFFFKSIPYFLRETLTKVLTSTSFRVYKYCTMVLIWKGPEVWERAQTCYKYLFMSIEV